MKNDGTASDKQITLSPNSSEDEAVIGKLTDVISTADTPFMKRVLEPENLQRAYNQVRRNRGAPGVDGMTVEMLSDYLKQHWLNGLRQQLLDGNYRPKPSRRVEIPKPDGRMRKLNIPVVVERFIQQAIAQVLQEEWEPHFHAQSFGYRPGFNAHQAIRYAQETMQTHSWIADCDIETFFDSVNHDLLMAKLKKRIHDPVLLRLINRFLTAGVQRGTVIEATVQGISQGSPLSPVLANILLNELDWELERRGHRFARYADDLVVFAKSRRAAERIRMRLQRFIERRLRLKVNADKSAVDRPWNRTFLGLTFSRKRGNKIKVGDKALAKLMATVRQLTRRTRGRSIMQIIEELRKSLLGWKAYFDISEVVSPLRDVDKWIRRRLRCYLWKQWGGSGYRQLRKRGVSVELAWNTSKSAHGPWRLSGSPALYQALPNNYFAHLGLPTLAARKST